MRFEGVGAGGDGVGRRGAGVLDAQGVWCRGTRARFAITFGGVVLLREDWAWGSEIRVPGRNPGC